jgi:predicted glycoside hydrolase/deacetylase ChbG (UPF0249 family)
VPIAARGDVSRLVLIVHADDCGLSAGTTDAILKCYDRGWLRRTSVVVNGAGWEYAVAALKQRPRLAVNLHLNLFEGAPLSSPADVDLLVDRHGRFCRRFTDLWLRGLTGMGAPRLREQMRQEIRRQVERFLDVFADRGPVGVDGHVHYHMLPLVFDELMDLSSEYAVDAIRLPREPFYWPLTRGAPRPPLVNVAKNVTLRLLSRRAAPALEARSMKTTDAFIGVLATGGMTLSHVRSALDCLQRGGARGTVEILFHPGRARPDEALLWSDRPELAAFYLSSSRDREAELLCSQALGDVLTTYGTVAEV